MSNVSAAKRKCLKSRKDVSASYRETEERVRQAREKLDEERMKKIDDKMQASLAHQRYRGQFEEQRKRRIDDVRTRNNERQSAVLERRRQILEAEMDRRKALLHMKLERGAKLEAEKNAQRNSMSFDFGSGSTPRLYESYGLSNSQSPVNLVLPADVNTTPTSRRSASLNRNFNAEDLMTKSRTSLPSSSFFGHGRHKTNLKPTLPEDKIHHAVTPQTRPSRGAAMRGAISMSRLDQLAQPRRRSASKTHEQDVSTSKQAPQKEKIKPKPAVAKKQEMKPIKSKTPSKLPSPDLHIEVQASDDNVNVMASKPDIVPDETLMNAPATDQPFAQDDTSLSPNHDKMSPPPSLLEEQTSSLLERQKEERIKKEEEEEARKAELEQIRLAEEHRQLEEEKLLKAIEDKERKDEEEQ